MNPQQIALVQSTWAKLTPHADQLAALFYDRLFEIAPEVKPLFTSDLLEQGRKLMAMIDSVVVGLAQLDKAAPTLRELGSRHQSYGVEPQHYGAVHAALMWTLEQALGDDFTDATSVAWAEAYQALAGVMKGATTTVAA